MKAAVLFFLGLCAAVPAHRRQEDPNATFKITGSTPQLRFRQPLPPGYTTGGDQQPPFPTSTGQPGFGGGPGFGPTGGPTAGLQRPESTPPAGGGQQSGNGNQKSDQSGREPAGSSNGTARSAPRNLRMPPFGGPPPPSPPRIGGHGPVVPGGKPHPRPGNRPLLRPDGSSPPPPQAIA
ncbi:hypothetical protein CHU98_g9884 [Xylaria longipes]|nr:hypothetical protein CHU98_g9884 [Xylaria longipes]